MLGKVKDILGIEGLKLDLEIPQEVSQSDRVLEGKVLLKTMRKQKVTSIQVRLVETFSRGRGDKARSNDYVLGQVSLNEMLVLEKNEEMEIPFVLQYVMGQSEMDRYEEQNFFMKTIVRLAKYARKVKSEYKIVAEAKVSGTKLSPFSEKSLIIA